MAGLCKASLIGNLGGDVDLRYTAQGRPFATFSLACNRTYSTADGERKEETEWFRVIAGGKLADVCDKYLSKGSRVYLEGRLSSKIYDGRDGEKRFSMQVSASELQMLSTRQNGEGSGGGEHRGGGNGGGDEYDDAGAADLDSIPF